MHCGCPRALGFAGQGTAWAGPVLTHSIDGSLALASLNLAAGILSRRFRNAHHHGFDNSSLRWLEIPRLPPRRALHLSGSCAPPFDRRYS
jgi:hypothetical protein